MGSSTRQGWIPETPDNEVEIARTMRAYRAGLELLGREGGIPAVMAELARINAAIQQQGQQALAAALTQQLQTTIGSLDAITLRSRPTASPSRGSERGRAATDSRPFLPQSSSLVPSTRGGLGKAAAARIAAARARQPERYGTK